MGTTATIHKTNPPITTSTTSENNSNGIVNSCQWQRQSISKHFASQWPLLKSKQIYRNIEPEVEVEILRVEGIGIEPATSRSGCHYHYLFGATNVSPPIRARNADIFHSLWKRQEWLKVANLAFVFGSLTAMGKKFPGDFRFYGS